MKKLFIALALLLAPLAVAVPASVSAQFDPFEQVCTGQADSESPACQTKGNDPIAGEEGVILRVVKLLGWVVGFVAVLMIIIAGLKFITANGDPASIKSARDTIIYALIGVAIFASSQLIVRFMLSRI